MNKSLKALEILRECANGEKKVLFSTSLELANTIKQDLENIEQLKKENENLKLENFNQYLVLNAKIDKLTKAIEILKDKLDITIVFDMVDLFTQQEYEVLKEVLENE